MSSLTNVDPNNALFQDAINKLRRTGLMRLGSLFKHLLELQSVGPKMGGSVKIKSLILDSTNNYMGKSWRSAFASEPDNRTL